MSRRNRKLSLSPRGKDATHAITILVGVAEGRRRLKILMFAHRRQNRRPRVSLKTTTITV